MERTEPFRGSISNSPRAYLVPSFTAVNLSVFWMITRQLFYKFHIHSRITGGLECYIQNLKLSVPFTFPLKVKYVPAHVAPAYSGIVSVSTPSGSTALGLCHLMHHNAIPA